MVNLRHLAYGVLLLALSTGACAAGQQVTDPSSASKAKEQDCFAVGNTQERETCFAQQDDAAIAECEKQRLFACAPYKKMHQAEQELFSLEKKIERTSDLQYGNGKVSDSEFISDLKKSFQDANADWRRFRDNDCSAEQYIAGTNRGREFGDLVEACRLEVTEDRIKKLRKYLQSVEPLEDGSNGK